MMLAGLYIEIHMSIHKGGPMHTYQANTKELQEILMDRNIPIFDLPLKERLVLLRHLLPKHGV